MQAFDLIWKGRPVRWEFQKPIGPFFADFAIPACKLVVEVDGGYHTEIMQQHRDASRTRYLEDAGWQVLRFTNEEVNDKLVSVMLAISHQIGIAV